MRFLHNILAKAGLIVDGVTQLNTIANATIDTDKFLVSDGGVIKYRTGAQLGSDIGAANLAASTLKHQVKLGEAINKGQAVYVSSADGTNMIVSKASNASEPTSSKTLGLIETSGVLNDQVNVVTEGLLAGLDTSTAAAGDPVWLGTGGNLIFGLANKPYAPAHLVFIGIVTRVQQNNGEIFVKVQNGFELKEIHDVQITTTPSDNTVLAYESATSLYKMKSIATLLGYTPANAARQLTINGTTYDLTADRTWSVGTVTSIATTGPITGGTITGSGTIGITQATTSSNGYLSSTDWNTFNNKQNALTLTTTGSSGASTLVGATLNIPTYSLSGLGGVPSSRQLTINGTAYDLSADRSWSVGTVTSVGVSVPTGLSVSNTPVTGSGTIAISFTAGYSIPTTASQTNWDTAYNNRITSLTTTGTSGAATLTSNTLNIPQYQAQGSYITSLTGEATASGPGAASVTLTNSAVIGKVLTGLNVTGGSISATDSILTAFGKLQNQVNGLAGGVTYQGTWNASTNSPSLTSSVGTKGYYYVVSVAGSTNLNGITDWKLGDWAIFNGTSWEKVDNTDAVVSVNGFTGAVSLTTSNISEGTNLYYTDARARAAISLTTTGSSGAATYTGGVLNIPQYSLSGLGGVPTSRQLTINGTAYDLSADRTWTITNISGNSATTSQTNFSSLTVNSNTVLHAGNYNSYAPTLTGTGASGTWGINITGSATTWNGLNFNGVSSRFTGDLNTLGLSGTSGIYNIGTGYTNGPSSGLYGTLFGIWNADISVQFWASYNGNFYWRKSVGNTYTGSTWLTLLDSSNYNSYSPTLTGGGASGTWGISITGNAATATSATNLYGAGGSYIQSTSSGTSYTANYQVRENSGGGSNTNEIYAPQLAFHWSGVVASSIMMESSGRIAIRNNPGSGYESFIAYDVYGSNSMRAPIFYDSNDTNYYVDPNSNSRLVNLGLGGVTPDVRLSVSGDAHISSTFYLGGTAGSSGSWGGRMYMSGGNMYYNALRHELNNVGYGSTWSVIAESGNLILSSGTSGTTGKFILKTTDNSDLNKYIMQDGYWTVIGTHSNEGFRVRDHNGNILLNVAGSTNGYPNRVGIGNTTPAYKLHVSGDIYADGGWLRVSGQQGLYFETYGGGWHMSDSTFVRSYNSKSVYSGSGIFRTDAGDTGFQNLGTANWYLLDFGDRAASAGRYGVGLTSDINNRTLSFHVPNHAAYSSSGNVPKFGWYSNGADELMTLQSATGNLWTKGNLTVAGTITEQSSLRYKENIAPIEDALGKVEQLKPVSYNKKGSDTKEIGLIAEDVFDVYPEFVLCDDDGQPLGVHYSRLTAVLIESVKELKKEINQLKSKN